MFMKKNVCLSRVVVLNRISRNIRSDLIFLSLPLVYGRNLTQNRSQKSSKTIKRIEVRKVSTISSTELRK